MGRALFGGCAWSRFWWRSSGTYDAGRCRDGQHRPAGCRNLVTRAFTKFQRQRGGRNLNSNVYTVSWDYVFVPEVLRLRFRRPGRYAIYPQSQLPKCLGLRFPSACYLRSRPRGVKKRFFVSASSRLSRFNLDGSFAVPARAL